MCILIIKPKNVDFPPDQYLIDAWVSNPDGAGIAWTDGKETFLRKGFMELNHFLLFVDTLRISHVSYDVMMHMRWATHGSVKKGNCHPFIVSPDVRDLQKCRYHGKDLILAHNGIVHGKEYNKRTKNDLSDTMLFTKRLYHLGISHEGIQKILHGGKFAIMNPDGITTYGHFIEESGILYSNDSYLPMIKYTTWDSLPDKRCECEDMCMSDGWCSYTGEDIADMIEFGDVEICPLAKDYRKLRCPDDYYWDEVMEKMHEERNICDR
jgi:hypothetical protein